MRKIRSLLLACAAAALFGIAAYAQSDVTQPGDPIIPSSSRSPGSEAVANAIDNQPTKYLNFDSGQNGFIPSGFVVTPSVGLTRVTGISMQSANDGPERDPKTFTLEGSIDNVVSNFNSGNWTTIAAISNITSWEALFGVGTSRFKTQTFFFANSRPYKHYRWIVHETQTTPNGCCMQIAEVELLGTTLPQDVTQPGDPIVPSSSRSPGSEAVANAIDNQPTKYLNFDSGQNGFIPSGFAVSPSIGRTLVTGISMQSANDGPERDPQEMTLEGSNDPSVTNYSSGNWTLITTISNIPSWESVFGVGISRFKTQTFFFDNVRPYRHYRWVVTRTQTTPNGCCMQIAEVEFLGTTAPVDVTQPGDPIIPSSSRSPGSEAVANAIDNQPTKYLNFDSGQNGFIPSGFAVSPSVGPTTVIGLTMQSANDGPERDPKTVTLEGSNDASLSGFNSGTWTLIAGITNITSWETLFGVGTSRFKVQEFFFPNNVSYKHYRWIVHETQTTPNGCCMQIAEVEFLAVPVGGNTNVISTLIRRQPQDTPVLLGAQATFRVLLTGPWLVQWYKNGVAVPGATAATYTTPAVIAGNDGDTYYAVVQSSQGTQKSDEVILSIFTPSAIQSVGLSWHGGGANGAPSDLFPEDITGFHPQAYWNNLAGGSGTLANPITSANAPSTITVTWASSGEWGVGTGEDDPTQRLLNGIFGWDDTANSADTMTATLTGVPPGTHSLLIYSVQVPLEFFNMNVQVVTHDAGGADVIQDRYIRPQNSDEYNPSPGYILVTAQSAAARSVGNMMRFDNLQPGPDGIIQINFNSPGRASLGGEPIRGPGVNGMQLLLNPGPAVQPPVITEPPVAQNGTVGGQLVLNVTATGPGVTYQWLRNGQAIQGATTPQLVIFNLSTNDVGKYSVAVENAAGRVVSPIAAVDVLQSEQLTEGLILYYTFDDRGAASGTDVTDSGPGGRHGGVRGVGIGEFPDGLYGAALTFDGAAYVVTPTYPKPSAAMTVSGWILVTSLQFGPLINNWVAANPIGSRGQFQLELASGPILNSRIGVGPNVPFSTGPAPAELFDWHHFAMSANGNTMSIYWDGVLVDSTDYLGALNTSASAAPFPWLAIGANLSADTNVAPATTLIAQLDDLAFWSRSLSGEEIGAIAHANLPLSQVPPVITVAPRLNIYKGANSVTISWRADFTGYVLESSPQPKGGVWTPVPGVANNSVTIANPTGAAFFRLKK